MDCPKCQSPYMIATTRKDCKVRGMPAERKRRRCPECGWRGNTFEIMEEVLQELQKDAHAGAVEETRDQFLAYVRQVKADAGAGAG